MKSFKSISTFTCVFALTACGGGGGGSSGAAPTTPTAFPVYSAMAAAYKGGLQKTLTLSGTASNNGSANLPVTGSLTLSIGATVSSVFEGAAALQSSLSANGTVSLGGQTAPISSQSLIFLSPSYEMVGVTYAGAHCVATTKGIFPATLTVGQSGGIGEYVCYTNSTKTSSIGKRVLEYSTTQGDSAEKINFKVSESYYDATGKLNSREGTTYTITVGGLATIGQYFIQSSGSTTLDLVGQ